MKREANPRKKQKMTLLEKNFELYRNKYEALKLFDFEE